MNNIDIQIKKNITLLREIEIIAKKITRRDNKRDMLFSSFFRTILSHHYSISILCEKKLYNSAFSLIRIFFEGVIRANYLYEKIQDEKIDRLYDGNGWNNAFPIFGKICEEMDLTYDTTFYTQIKTTAYKSMNDYTHTGFQQISRNFNSDKGTVEVTFKKDLIIDSLEGINAIVYIFSIGYFEKIGLKYGEIEEEAIQSFMDKYTKEIKKT